MTCRGLLGWIFGHKFVRIYSPLKPCKSYEYSQTIYTFKCCKRCGMTIEDK